MKNMFEDWAVEAEETEKTENLQEGAMASVSNEEDTYFMDELIMEAARVKGLKKDGTLTKPAMKNFDKAFGKITFDDNMKDLLKKRKQIALDFYNLPRSKNKNFYQGKLDYLKERKVNGLAIIDAKVARYRKRHDAYEKGMNYADAVGSLTEDLMEERYQFTDEDRKKAKEARFNNTDDSKKWGEASGLLSDIRKKSYGDLLKVSKDKNSLDIEILEAKRDYVKLMIDEYTVLRKAFVAYMNAFIAHVEKQLEDAPAPKTSRKKKQRSHPVKKEETFLFD